MLAGCLLFTSYVVALPFCADALCPAFTAAAVVHATVSWQSTCPHLLIGGMLAIAAWVAW